MPEPSPHQGGRSGCHRWQSQPSPNAARPKYVLTCRILRGVATGLFCTETLRGMARGCFASGLRRTGAEKSNSPMRNKGDRNTISSSFTAGQVTAADLAAVESLRCGGIQYSCAPSLGNSGLRAARDLDTDGKLVETWDSTSPLVSACILLRNLLEYLQNRFRPSPSVIWERLCLRCGSATLASVVRHKRDRRKSEE